MRRKLRVFVSMISIIRLLSLIGSCIVALVRSLGYAYIVAPIFIITPWIGICLVSFFDNDFAFLFYCFLFVCAFVVIFTGNLLQLTIHYLIHYIIDDF